MEQTHRRIVGQHERLTGGCESDMASEMLMLKTATADEHWRDIPGFEGRYQASDHGRIRSLDREIEGVCAGRRITKWRRGKVLSPITNLNRYRQVFLCTDGVKRIYSVHRLVCLAFHGQAPTPRHQVAHWDGTRDNNASANLRWAWPSQNALDKRRHGTAANARKISEDAAREIIERLNRGDSQKSIIADIGLSKGLVNNIALKRSWKHLSHLLHR